MQQTIPGIEPYRNSREVAAYEHRLKGYSFNEIARKVGCSKDDAIAWVREMQLELAQEMGDIQFQRMDAIHTLNMVLKSRFIDLEKALDQYDEEGYLIKDNSRARGEIIKDITKIVDQKAKIIGLYTIHHEHQFNSPAIDTPVVDYSKMSGEELKVLYAEKMRQS